MTTHRPTDFADRGDGTVARRSATPPEWDDDAAALFLAGTHAALQQQTETYRKLAGIVQGDYNQLSLESTLIRHFEVTVVPGLLQTPAYARAMFAEMAEFVGPEAGDLDAAVAARLQRQALLYQPGRRFEFLLAETVLRWLLVPPEVMRGQLDRLHTVIGLSNVRFGVLPLGVQLHTIPQHSVVIYQGSETVAAVELFAAESFHRGEDAEVFNRAIDRLWADAVIGEDAHHLVAAAAHAL